MRFAPTVGEGYREDFSVVKYSNSHDDRKSRLIGIKCRVDNAETAYDIAGTGIDQVLMREPNLKKFPANHSARFIVDFIIYPWSIDKAGLLNSY